MKNKHAPRLHFNKDGKPLCNLQTITRQKLPESRLTKDKLKVTCGNCKQTLNRS